MKLVLKSEAELYAELLDRETLAGDGFSSTREYVTLNDGVIFHHFEDDPAWCEMTLEQLEEFIQQRIFLDKAVRGKRDENLAFLKKKAGIPEGG